MSINSLTSFSQPTHYLERPIPKYASKNELGYEDLIRDGFVDADMEIIVIDSENDPELAAFVQKCQRELGSTTGTERVSKLAKLIHDAMGGHVSMQLEEQCQKALGPSSSIPIPLGKLIGHAGMTRHRALLFKYLADHSVIHPQQWHNISLQAQLFRSKSAIPHAWNTVRIENEHYVPNLAHHPDQLLLQSNYLQELAKEASEPMPQPKPETPQLLPPADYEQFYLAINRQMDQARAGLAPLPFSLEPIQELESDLIHLADIESEQKQIALPKPPKQNVETSKKVALLLKSLQPLDAGFKDRFWLACFEARCIAYEKLGELDKKMIIDDRVGADFYIIHRKNGNVMLASSGLADLTYEETLPNTTGLGLEIVAEADEKEVGSSVPQLRKSWFFHMMSELVLRIKQYDSRIRQLLDDLELILVELDNVNAPPLYTTPEGRIAVLMGISAQNKPECPLPDFIQMPQGRKVRLVTVRLLRTDEIHFILQYGAGARKAISSWYTFEGLYHISTTQTGQRDPILVTPEGRVIIQSPKPPTASDLEGDEKKFVEQPYDHPDCKGRNLPNLTDPKVLHFIHSPAVNQEINVAMIRLEALEKRNGGGGFNWERTQSRDPKDPNLLLRLHPLDVMSYIPPVTADPIFSEFAPPSALSHALNLLECHLKAHVRMPVPTKETIKHILEFLSMQSAIAGWQHCDVFVRDPQNYVEQRKQTKQPLARMSLPADGIPGERLRTLYDLKITFEWLMKRLIQRVERVLKHQQKAKEQFDPHFCTMLIAADEHWMNDTLYASKEAEIAVARLIRKNPQRFASFKELQHEVVEWPHGDGLRAEIEAAGFVYRPMMIKRDLCVCPTCNAEVSGWRPWHQPWNMHNPAGHPEGFAAEMKKKQLEARKAWQEAQAKAKGT